MVKLIAGNLTGHSLTAWWETIRRQIFHPLHQGYVSVSANLSFLLSNSIMATSQYMANTRFEYYQNVLMHDIISGTQFLIDLIILNWNNI